MFNLFLKQSFFICFGTFELIKENTQIHPYVSSLGDRMFPFLSFSSILVCEDLGSLAPPAGIIIF